MKYFNQVVSSDSSGGIHVWEVDTGRMVFKFDAGCRVTSMCFDHAQRRLITGSKDGRLKKWNFSNGQALMEFENTRLDPSFDAYTGGVPLVPGSAAAIAVASTSS
jgi:WD40 repeat protein